MFNRGALEAPGKDGGYDKLWWTMTMDDGTEHSDRIDVKNDMVGMGLIGAIKNQEQQAIDFYNTERGQKYAQDMEMNLEDIKSSHQDNLEELNSLDIPEQDYSTEISPEDQAVLDDRQQKRNEEDANRLNLDVDYRDKDTREKGNKRVTTRQEFDEWINGEGKDVDIQRWTNYMDGGYFQKGVGKNSRENLMDHLSGIEKIKEPYEDTGKSQHASASSAIKRELKKEYPDTKFRVRSQSYSMGDSVGVSWDDGPTSEDVDSIIGKYQYGNFNGMTDSYEHSNKRDDIPQTKFVSTSREMSDETKAVLENQIAEETGRPFDANADYENDYPSLGNHTEGYYVIRKKFTELDHEDIKQLHKKDIGETGPEEPESEPEEQPTQKPQQSGDWWSKMTPEQKQQYRKTHPRSRKQGMDFIDDEDLI